VQDAVCTAAAGMLQMYVEESSKTVLLDGVRILLAEARQV
jgi:hypothetical protein